MLELAKDELTGMLRDFRNVEQPKLESIACRVPECTAKNDRVYLYLFIALMLVTTTIYMAWNVREVHHLRQDVSEVVGAKRDATDRAKLFVDELAKQKRWNENKVGVVK